MGMMNETIKQLRQGAGMSQAKLAEAMGVSPQAVQKWESGSSQPDTDKLVRMANFFGVSLDHLILGRDTRTAETASGVLLTPELGSLLDWENYCEDLTIDYRQSYEEGLDIARYEDIFKATAKLPLNPIKQEIANSLFKLESSLPMREGYPYVEPSTIEQIRALRPKQPDKRPLPDMDTLTDRIRGAWYGRICGCMLGRTVEGINTSELIPFLKESDNYPMHRYILSTDLPEDVYARYGYPFRSRDYADQLEAMVADDDTNYMVLDQLLIERCGRDFTPRNVARLWSNLQPKNAYCTAERVAYCNFIKGYTPPASAQFQNPYREWIGAQIRGDYFGYINAGDPETAADMAFRDASISHIKNGIYGEMFVAAMIARAAVSSDMVDIIRAGLSQIPMKSRLTEAVERIIEQYQSGMSEEEAFAGIHTRWNESDSHDWCHTISNAEIVVACLLYGEGDYGRSICRAVQTGFDTDCNGATVGSVLGMCYGMACIDECWTAPMHGKLDTAIFGVGRVNIEDCVMKTVEHFKAGRT